MKPYASYKPSGVPWLGDIPAHWGVVPLKFFLKSLSGGSTIKNTVAHEYVPGLFPAFSASGQDVWMEDYEFDSPGIVVSAVGARCGKTFRADGQWGTVANTHVLLPAEGSCRDYFWYLTNDEDFWDKGGTAQPFVKVSSTLAKKVAAPSPDEQQAIADYLEAETARIDTLIHEKDELIGLLREARSSRISELISGDGLPGTPTGNPWAPHLPEGWELKRLKHLAQVRSGLAKGKDNGSNPTVELPYLRVANVQEGSLDLREISTMPVEVDVAERFCLMEGDVLMNEGGDYDKVGRGAVWTGEISPCLHQNHVFAVRPVARNLSEWLSAITQTQYAKFYFMNNAKQSTNLASISQANVKELPILLPPKDQREALLKKLGAELVAFDGLIAHTNDEITLLKELRAATIADAVLGRIDVRGTAKKIAVFA